QPAAAAPLGQRLAKVFGGYEYVPTREDLLAVAPEAELVPALWALYHAPEQRLAVRTQALVSLRFFPSEQVLGWFETVLRDPATVAAVRRPAAKAYGFAFGERAVSLLGELLGHEDLHTRDSAARALGAIASPAARQKLSERDKVESEPSVKATLAAELAKPARKP
ncbi:MAG: HEAT repeat domain-containing protein, partial [Deltaproteobacteria bacterium]|nr:HEAT repeat domain-containing protein [Deltaproteobacteria bacterium]